MSKIPTFSYCYRKVNATKFFHIDICIFRTQNLLKQNDEESSHFVFIYMAWELLHLTSKVTLSSIFLDVYLHGKYQNDACIFSIIKNKDGFCDVLT